MEYNYLDYNMVVFDNYLYIDIDHQLNNSDKYIDNVLHLYLIFVDIEINNYKVTLHMMLIDLKNKPELKFFFFF